MQRISTLTSSAGLFGSDLFPERETRYYVDEIIIKEGRTLISGTSGLSNFVLSCTLAIALASDVKKFAETFKIQKAKVLFLELEKGDYYFYEYVKYLLKDRKPVNLYFRCLPGLDLEDENQLDWLEKEIEQLKIEVLFITPLEFCFKNARFDVHESSLLRASLDKLIAKYKISVVLTSTDGYSSFTRNPHFLVFFDEHVYLRRNYLDCLRSVHSRKFSPVQIKLAEDNYLFSLYKEQISVVC